MVLEFEISKGTSRVRFRSLIISDLAFISYQ